MNALFTLPTAFQQVSEFFHNLFIQVHKKPRLTLRSSVRKKSDTHGQEENPVRENEPQSFPNGLYLPQSVLDELTLKGKEDLEGEEGIEIHYFEE